MIFLASFMEGDRDILKTLCKEVRSTFGECKILDKDLEIPKEAFNKEKGKYDSKYFLEELLKHQRTDSDKIAGITEVDLFTQDMNFVFGQAIMGGNACVVSMNRLETRTKGESGLFEDRAIKEILHELGHCFGLEHCNDKKCVMVFSNTLQDVDAKGKTFCYKCMKSVGNKMIKIRPFTPSDLNRVYEIESRAFKDPYHPMFLLNIYQAYPGGFFVAETWPLVIGYVTARIVGGKGHILAIATDQNYRRRGIGSTLMEKVIEYLIKNGVRMAQLEVRISNSSAINFYKSIGFKEASIIPRYYKDGENGMLLFKEIKVVAK